MDDFTHKSLESSQTGHHRKQPSNTYWKMRSDTSPTYVMPFFTYNISLQLGGSRQGRIIQTDKFVEHYEQSAIVILVLLRNILESNIEQL